MKSFPADMSWGLSLDKVKVLIVSPATVAGKGEKKNLSKQRGVAVTTSGIFFWRGSGVLAGRYPQRHVVGDFPSFGTASGNDLDNVTFYIDLHIDGESTEVDAPPDIIDVPGEDDDISDDEDPLPHDLADSDVEDLINDDDGVEKMADVARAHGGDGGGEDPSRPPPTSFGCAGCFINRGKGKRKPNLGGVKAGRKTRERTRNQVLKDAVAANKGRPIEIGFEDRADNTVVPTGPYSTQWGNYFGEMSRSIPLYPLPWQKSTYNLEPHMRSERWPRIEGYIQAQFGKSYNTNKATLKREHWIRDPETGAYDLDRIRRGKPDEYTDDEWEKYINFWNDPANAQRAETNRLNRSKSTVVSRHGSRSIPLTRHLMEMTSATQEEHQRSTRSIVSTPFNGVFKILWLSDVCEGDRGDGPIRRFRLSYYTAPVDRKLGYVDFMMKLDEERQQADFFRKKSGNAAVQAVYKKKLQTFPQRHVAGENPAKGQNSRGEKR
ncbi:hypothetical protein Tco_0801701 [Tanacetum coccineum]|uniref:Uncharacterized protein n=1 Tax=Tanacetum coccineum TaxID=301880 RepID=A0ABQ5A100_9ASTR